MFNGSVAVSLQEMKKTVCANYQALIAIDETFAIEYEFLSQIVPKQINVELERMVLSALPSDVAYKPYTQAVVGLACSSRALTCCRVRFVCCNPLNLFSLF